MVLDGSVIFFSLFGAAVEGVGGVWRGVWGGVWGVWGVCVYVGKGGGVRVL